jgi:hypothetical protein
VISDLWSKGSSPVKGFLWWGFLKASSVVQPLMAELDLDDKKDSDVGKSLELVVVWEGEEDNV